MRHTLEERRSREVRCHHFRGRLQVITQWEALAEQACYSSAALARLCEVSLRHLQRHIQCRYGQPLGHWLNRLRLRHAYQKLAGGGTVKETAFSLGYKQVSHFSRSFKNRYGFNPSTVPALVGFNRNGAPTHSASGEIQLVLFSADTSKECLDT